ncbi:MAG: hypothetical protein KF732_10885 [Flavobacteriales bacterium]|jgi:hypothetical protein|nr:hypothetical protein [Flavobacteriales bacterium]MBX2960447.1 hypothetical protein [Flavobacteriales bacterium]HRN42795.1 hypothetical protein [Vicingus sp.]
MGICDLFKKEKFDIDFSEKNLNELTIRVDSICEFLNKNEIFDYIYLFENIKEAAANYDFKKFREACTNYSLVGTMDSINEGISSDSVIESQFKKEYRDLLDIIIKMGYKHPDIIKTYKSLKK